jgi:glycosyltransferase involved in cell wall biosynthesis
MESNNDKGKLLPQFSLEATVFNWNELCRIHGPEQASQVIKKETRAIDLIYGNTLLSAKAYPFLADGNLPVITHVHELEQSIRKQLTDNDIAVFKQFTSNFIACSASVGANLRLNHGIAPEKIDLVYEFIGTTTESKPDQINQRRLLCIPENKTIIWGCGTIDWRKGTDLFIRTASSLRKQNGDDFLFIWIGQNTWDNEYNDWGSWQAQADFILEHQLSDYILFLGEKEVPSNYFGCGDIFYLPSREDPFPLVCIEAADAGLPLVCFAGAGGMDEFVGTDAGFLVPFADVESAAHAIGNLINDKDLREQLGKNAKKRANSSHSDDIALPAILQVCRKALSVPPMVTVLVPVYNQERFISARIESILNQTYRDVEILILDDASSDQGYAVASEYASHPAVSIIRNGVNSGSPFGQWQSGIEQANGRFIWIAEGDDLADPMFLETLLPFFNNPAVNLAYCNSHAIDSEGNIQQYYYQKNHYYKNLAFSEERWMEDYTSPGIEEIVHALSIRNTIPNVSAVLWRTAVTRELNLDDCAKFRNTGDWYAYISILKSGMISYSSSPLNYHRIHSLSVVSRNRATAENTLPDYSEMHRYIVREFKIPAEIQQLMRKSISNGLRSIWPELTENEFQTYYHEAEIFQDDYENVAN